MWYLVCTTTGPTSIHLPPRPPLLLCCISPRYSSCDWGKFNLTEKEEKGGVGVRRGRGVSSEGQLPTSMLAGGNGFSSLTSFSHFRIGFFFFFYPSSCSPVISFNYSQKMWRCWQTESKCLPQELLTMNSLCLKFLSEFYYLSKIKYIFSHHVASKSTEVVYWSEMRLEGFPLFPARLVFAATTKKNWDSCDASSSETQPLLPNCLQIFRRFPCVCPTFVPIRWGTHAEM